MLNSGSWFAITSTSMSRRWKSTKCLRLERCGNGGIRRTPNPPAGKVPVSRTSLGRPLFLELHCPSLTRRKLHRRSNPCCEFEKTFPVTWLICSAALLWSRQTVTTRMTWYGSYFEHQKPSRNIRGCFCLCSSRIWFFSSFSTPRRSQSEAALRPCPHRMPQDTEHVQLGIVSSSVCLKEKNLTIRRFSIFWDTCNLQEFSFSTNIT